MNGDNYNLNSKGRSFSLSFLIMTLITKNLFCSSYEKYKKDFKIQKKKKKNGHENIGVPDDQQCIQINGITIWSTKMECCHVQYCKLCEVRHEQSQMQ